MEAVNAYALRGRESKWEFADSFPEIFAGGKQGFTVEDMESMKNGKKEFPYQRILHP